MFHVEYEYLRHDQQLHLISIGGVSVDGFITAKNFIVRVNYENQTKFIHSYGYVVPLADEVALHITSPPQCQCPERASEEELTGSHHRKC